MTAAKSQPTPQRGYKHIVRDAIFREVYSKLRDVICNLQPQAV
jgi:hypothetical protein